MRIFRQIAATLWLLAVLLYWLSIPAKADIGGSVPSPGDCTYPAVGTFGAAFGEYDFACQFPVEENGSRHTTLFGGGMWQVSLTAGVAIVFFNASITATAPAGVLRGVTYWACPDFSMADQPNPPGAWKNYLTPKPCKSIAPKPVLIPDGMPAPPVGAPPPPAPPPIVGSALQPALNNPMQPSVTNPDNPNPDATVDPNK